MFEGDLTTLSTPDLLESAAEHRAEANRLDTRLLEHAQTYADRHHPDTSPTRPEHRPGRSTSDGRERAIVLGGDGCPEIAEFAPAEFGVMLGISAGAAADFIGQALALRHRLPLTWARVQAGQATPWKARKIATACLDLSEDAARSVDRRVCRVVDSLTPIRLDKIVDAAKNHADPDAARKKAAEKARERGVYLARSDEHGTKRIHIRTGTGDAIRFNARIGSIAEALKVLGDTNPLQSRRADAVGIIADPRYTEELLHQAHKLLNARPAPPGPPADTGSGGTQTTDTAAEATTDDGARRAAPTVAGRDTGPGAGMDKEQSTAPTADPATDQGSASTAGTTTDQNTAPSTASTTARTAHAARRGVGPTADAATERGTSSSADRSSAPASCRVSDRGDLSTADPASARHKASTAEPGGAECGRRARGGADHGAYSVDEGLLEDWAEPGLDDEADRDAPHPSHSDLPDPLDTPFKDPVEPFDPGLRLDHDDDGEALDAEARRALDARLAQIRHDAHTNPRSGGRLRAGQTEIYVHLTDHTLATGTGVLRVEDLGPLLASQLSELVGHGPYVVKPVIDLNDAVSVDAYEIPDRIRERVKLTHPVELFPYGTRETHAAMDLDHIEPYDPLGPPGQTTPANLAPLRRFPHRVKTHGRKVRRLDPRTLEWLTPNGFAFHVDPTGTHRAPQPNRDA
ncbi:hypothetical protein EV652_10976 [Kribbella steppae]|uniref:DUF222 domain-containing protein n=1 Tax=Kribbella steppae TaxID=2512223 RepID=A0A4R2HBZ8_9ACTN|nr:hypothetical protein [Kribbella steppae]TCO23251.1 hypothetical protein EV652_10976 [Kribbella steppae]